MKIPVCLSIFIKYFLLPGQAMLAVHEATIPEPDPLRWYFIAGDVMVAAILALIIDIYEDKD